MSRYEELRHLFQEPPEARAALTRREMLAALERARADLAELAGAGLEHLQAAFGARSEELVEIAAESATNLQQLLDTLPPDGSSATDAAGIRALRHDLRGPVGTLRGAAMMLARRNARPDDRLAERAAGVTRAAEELRDIVDALLEDERRL